MQNLTFQQERREAMIEFVMRDDPHKFYNYCRHYDIRMPANRTVVAGSIYKAVQTLKDVPDEVKKVAAEKCRKLGMYPYTLEGGEI